MKLLSYSLAYGAASAVAAFSLFGGASFAQASSFTSVQVQAVINLLQAFGADASTISNVQSSLSGQMGATSPSVTQTSTTTNNSIVLQFSVRLRPGMKGDDVKHLQEILASDSDNFSKEMVTGFFGPITEDALKHFQKRFGITPSGVVGPATMEKLNDLLDERAIHGDEYFDDNEFSDLDNKNDDEQDDSDHIHATSGTSNATTTGMRRGGRAGDDH